MTARPDSRYGLSKHFGEGLGALYAYKHGIGVTSLRIGNVSEEPIDRRRLAIWITPDDLVQLIRIGLEQPGLVYEVMYGVSDNKRSWYDNSRAAALGYKPEDHSEEYAAAVLGNDPPGEDNPSEFYQGGTFCGAEYTADFAAMKTEELRRPWRRSIPTRVLGDLRHLRTIGAYKTGVHRPSLSPEHVQSLHWLKAETEAIGHRAVIDGIGNVLGNAAVKGRKHARAARISRARTTPAGSTGRSVSSTRWRPPAPSRPIRRCATAPSMSAPGATRRAISARSSAHARRAARSARPRSTGARPHPRRRHARRLKRAGLAGAKREIHRRRSATSATSRPISSRATGSRRSGLKIGVVTSIVGITQIPDHLQGAQNHAGTTRMAIRRDAGLAAAQSRRRHRRALPEACGPRTVWTVGNIAFDPGEPSIIPGEAVMLFQFRDTDPAVHAAARGRGAPARRGRQPRGAVPRHRREAAPDQARGDGRELPGGDRDRRRGARPGGHTRMPSGAGHDAQMFADHMPSAMLFVPSIGGISHHWTENTSDDDIVLGAQVFVDAAVDLLKA